MAYIRKHGKKWQALVRKKPYPPITKSFQYKGDALAWTVEQERLLDLGKPPLEDHYDLLKILNVAKLLDRYEQQVAVFKKSPSDHYHLRTLKTHLGKMPLQKFRTPHLSEYKQVRLKTAAKATVAKEMTILLHALKLASEEWGIPIDYQQFKKIRKPSVPSGRTRRLEEGELELLVEALSKCRNPLILPIFNFAIQTAMRRGEILSLTWQYVHFDKRVAFLPITKNGTSREVPLTTEAMKILGNLHNGQDNVFPISANAFRLSWERAKRRSGVVDFRFHDLRHEAVSRFFEMGLSVPEVALISGHKDPRMLFRYTQLRAMEVASKLP